MRACPHCGTSYYDARSTRHRLAYSDENFDQMEGALDGMVNEAVRLAVDNVRGSARRPVSRWPQLLTSAQRQITSVGNNPNHRNASNLLNAANRALEAAAEELERVASGQRQNAVLNPIVDALYQLDAARRVVAQRSGNLVKPLNDALELIAQGRAAATANILPHDDV